MKLISFIFCIFFVLGSYGVETTVATTCLTSKCHSDLSEQKYLHSPLKAKGCVVCHQLIDNSLKSKKLSAKHPSVLLDMGKDQTSLCLKCHVEWGRKFKAKSFAHTAIAKIGCTGCHNPHSSDNAKLLKNKNFNQELCLSCHKKSENWEKGDKDTVHRGINVKNKCLNCHEIHSANQTKLLLDKPVTLCIKCHEEIMATKEKGSLHTPVLNGECLKCHSPHYGAKENLLDKTYEPDTYVKNVEASFQLCFNCHAPFKKTGFRNGDKNLHELHILNKDKSKDGKERGCVACHAVHGSKQPMQIQTSFTYKKMTLPLLFEKQANGGNCTTACHGRKDYDRISPVTNKEGR